VDRVYGLAVVPDPLNVLVPLLRAIDSSEPPDDAGVTDELVVE
jgi:hypothetical protein